MKTSSCVGWVVRLAHTGTVPSFVTQRRKPGTRRLYVFMRWSFSLHGHRELGCPGSCSWYVSGELAAEKVTGSKGERTTGAF